MPVARRRSYRGVWTAALVLLLRAPATAGITDCAGLCGTQNPCTISGPEAKEVEPGAVLDCSDRSITIANGRIEVLNGSFVLKAIRLTVNQSRSIEAKCNATGKRPGGFSIILSDRLDLHGFLRASCDFGGGFVRVTAAGDLNISDTGGAFDDWGVLANGMGPSAAGGRIRLESETGHVAIGDPIKADVDGSGTAPGGSIEILAPVGNVTVTAPLVATGRQDRGGSIRVEAGGDVTLTDNVEADGRLQQGDGGDVHLGAGDALVVGGPVSAQGGLGSGGGEATGGVINLEAGLGGVAINAALNATSGAQGPGGDGGALVVQSLGSINVSPGVSLLARSDKNGGDGGGISLVTHGARRCSGNTALRCDSDADCTGAGSCQLVGGQLTVGSSATLDARGHTGQGGQGAGAKVELRGCSVSLASGAVITATGYDGGEVAMTGRGSLTVDGTVTATGTSENGVIRLVTPDGTAPSIGGSLSPSPELASDGVHPCS